MALLAQEEQKLKEEVHQKELANKAKADAEAKLKSEESLREKA